MHTLVSKIVALSDEKYYTALTERQLKIRWFHGSLAKKVTDPCVIGKGDSVPHKNRRSVK